MRRLWNSCAYARLWFLVEFPRGCVTHRCKRSLVNRARFTLLSMGLGCFVGARARAQVQPAAPPVQTPAPVQGSTPEQMAVPQTPQDQVGEKPGDSHPSEQGGSTPDLRRGPGDLVEVSVYGVPELATKARVSNDGDLYLPLIDYVHVADLSLEESQKLIEKRLDDGGFVRNPHVTIFVDEFSSQAVSLLTTTCS